MTSLNLTLLPERVRRARGSGMGKEQNGGVGALPSTAQARLQPGAGLSASLAMERQREELAPLTAVPTLPPGPPERRPPVRGTPR